ncbi:NAD(P)/FAD-dependent oxidoreductase [Aureimonas populi]|uniref:NAD(P)/FAD-dependent oxidoreductase n=1 Tax=Aureimonas populi TaxID=1701758 RepID=A0ABW5CKA1_9HYPH|nr:FAD-binding oxidoreductase [Aureimonas populi]
MSLSAQSHGLWARTAPPAPALDALAGEASADVAIIGAGYTGLSAALHLAEGGARVVVLEAEEPGFGGSGRNVGLVNAGMWVMPDDLPGVLGSEHGERLLRCLGNAPSLVFELIEKHAIACEPVRAGTLHCAVGEEGLAELALRERQWRSRGADVRLLDARQTEEKVGSAAYPGSLLDMRAGTIQPLAYARGLAAAAIAAGAAIHDRSPVLSAEDTGAGWRLRTPSGSLTAKWVVVAGNAYVHGPWSQARRQLVQLPYFNLATAPLPEDVRAGILPERQGAWDTRAVLSSFRMDAAGRLVFGSVGALRAGGARVHAAWAKRALKRLFPQLPPAEFETGWYGMIGMTADNLPRFHRFGRNVIGFCGYNGRGIGTGTAFGKILSGLVLGEADTVLPLPESAVAPRRFSRPLSAFYEAGAQATHLTSDRF